MSIRAVQVQMIQAGAMSLWDLVGFGKLIFTSGDLMAYKSHVQLDSSEAMPISKAGSDRFECGEEKTISILGARELTSVV